MTGQSCFHSSRGGQPCRHHAANSSAFHNTVPKSFTGAGVNPAAVILSQVEVPFPHAAAAWGRRSINGGDADRYFMDVSPNGRSTEHSASQVKQVGLQLIGRQDENAVGIPGKPNGHRGGLSQSANQVSMVTFRQRISLPSRIGVGSRPASRSRQTWRREMPSIRDKSADESNTGWSVAGVGTCIRVPWCDSRRLIMFAAHSKPNYPDCNYYRARYLLKKNQLV